MSKNRVDQYIRYYLNQQQGSEMPVSRGSPWQVEHGQTAYISGRRHFPGVATAVMAMVKNGAKTLRNISLTTTANLLGDLFSGRSIERSTKSRLNEEVNIVKRKAVNKLQLWAKPETESV